MSRMVRVYSNKVLMLVSLHVIHPNQQYLAFLVCRARIMCYIKKEFISIFSLPSSWVSEGSVLPTRVMSPAFVDASFVFS